MIIEKKMIKKRFSDEHWQAEQLVQQEYDDRNANEGGRFLHPEKLLENQRNAVAHHTFIVIIFRTNVEHEDQANEVLVLLMDVFPQYQMNFDLDDEDNILRVKARTINVGKLLTKLENFGVNAELLD